MRKQQAWLVSLAAAAALAGATSALANPLPFTWNPAGASPALVGSAFTADTIIRQEFLRSVVQPDGSFLASRILVITGFSPTFATRGPELFKWLIFRSERSQGRHHKVAGHADCGTPAAITLGRGWLGKLNCKRWSRMAWSSSGSV